MIKQGRIELIVYDSFNDCPASGLEYTLIHVHRSDGKTPLRNGNTDLAGSTQYPLLEGDWLVEGDYLLDLSTGVYYAELKDIIPNDIPLNQLVDIQIKNSNRNHTLNLKISPKEVMISFP